MQASQSVDGNNDAQLVLDAPIKDKVPASYTQYIRINGRRVALQTSLYHTKAGLFFYCAKNQGKCLRVPLDDWLRQQLLNIEKDVMMKVSIPDDVPKSKEGTYVYKPLYLGDSMLITVSKFCRYFKYDKSQGGYVFLDEFEPFNVGQYNVNIDVSHVYIGPHKGGQNFSLSLMVTEITYKADEEDDATYRLDVPDSAPLQATTQGKKKTEKRSKKTSAPKSCKN